MIMGGIVCCFVDWLVQGGFGIDSGVELRIHDGIERGDNESTKIPKSTLGGGTGTDGCCSP